MEHENLNNHKTTQLGIGAVISRFFIGQKIPSTYKTNKGYTVVDIDEKRDRILMRQEGIEKPQWFTLSEFQNGL
jgi:hypothetical protein